MGNSHIPSAKPKLLGAAEDSEGIIVTPATAALSGSLTLDDSFDSNDVLRSPAVFSGKTLDIGAQELSVRSIAFSPDGMRLFMSGASNDSIHQYNLTTAFDLDTASFSGISFDASSQDTDLRGLTISNDGFRIFLIGNINDSIFQYNLTTAFDLSTASFSGNSLDVDPQDEDARDLTISPDGFTLFMIGSRREAVFQYNLTTANDLSTATFSGLELDVSDQDTNPKGVAISPDGMTIFVAGDSNDMIFQYNLTTAFDVSTGSFSGNSLDVFPQDTTASGLAISTDGFTLFMVGDLNNLLFQYDLLFSNLLGTTVFHSFFTDLTITTEFAQVNAGTLKVGTRVVCVVTGLVGTTLDLQRNASTIATLVPVINPNAAQPDFYSSFVDTITSEEPYTYGLRIPTNPVTIGSTVLLVFPIEPDDTHAGIIDSVAVPGKQINAADSHRTHEQDVLPD